MPLQPIISADSVYAKEAADFNLQPNRIISSAGELIGEGQRPGFPPLAKQIELLRRKPGMRDEVVLLDSGAFSGDSILRMVNLFEEKGIKVSRVLLGVEVIGATDILKEKNIECRSVLKIKDPIDWIEARDFIPFVPLCGRVIGDERGPILINGLSFAAPYLLPTGNPAKWASIPEKKVKDFSRQCWKISQDLFTNLEEFNPGLSITLEDIKRIPVRTSYPEYPSRDINMSTKILEVIRTNLNCLK